MTPKLKISTAVLTGMAIGAVCVHTLHAQAKMPMAYVVSEPIEIKDQTLFMQAVKDANTKHKANGGRYLAIGGKIGAVAGDAPKRITIIAFDSFEKARQWFASAEYAQINATFEKSGKTRTYIVEGAPE